MGFQGYIARIVFVVLVAIAFSYRAQIMDAINRTLDKSTSNPDTSEQVKASAPAPTLKTPEPDYYNPPFDPADPSDTVYTKSGHRLVTKNELAAHAHSGPLKPVWLALMGKVFNVDKGAEHYYGPNGGYKFFTGASICVNSGLVSMTAMVHYMGLI